MPTTRRSRGAQKTLAFNNSKVTKRPHAPNLKDQKQPPKIDVLESAIKTPTTTAIAPDVGHVSSQAAVKQQAQDELERVKTQRTPEEEKAAGVTDAQIRRYWKAREAERKAPRVHQGDLRVEEKVLRLFDISSQYGPCMGIARMKRWVRANKLGLNPPIEVLAVLLKEEEKGNSGIESAYLDELMSSKTLGDEN